MWVVGRFDMVVDAAIEVCPVIDGDVVPDVRGAYLDRLQPRRSSRSSTQRTICLLLQRVESSPHVGQKFKKLGPSFRMAVQFQRAQPFQISKCRRHELTPVTRILAFLSHAVKRVRMKPLSVPLTGQLEILIAILSPCAIPPPMFRSL